MATEADLLAGAAAGLGFEGGTIGAGAGLEAWLGAGSGFSVLCGLALPSVAAGT